MADLHLLCEVDLPRALALGLNHSCRVERAYRIGRDTSFRGADMADAALQPRQIIIRFLDFNDKMEILRAYRKKEMKLQLRGAKIL